MKDCDPGVSTTKSPPAATESPPICAIVLAGGLSSRMGEFKQLLPLVHGSTVIETVVERLTAGLSEQDEALVVVGHRAADVRERLRSHPVRCVFNERYEDGMVTSVQCGLRAARRGAGGYLVCLGDQPDLSVQVIGQVLGAGNRLAAGIVIPTYAQKRGHPIYLARKYRDEILRLDADKGLNSVTRAHPGDTHEVAVGAGEVLEDMDTPEDYSRIFSRLQKQDQRGTSESKAARRG